MSHHPVPTEQFPALAGAMESPCRQAGPSLSQAFESAVERLVTAMSPGPDFQTVAARIGRHLPWGVRLQARRRAEYPVRPAPTGTLVLARRALGIGTRNDRSSAAPVRVSAPARPSIGTHPVSRGGRLGGCFDRSCSAVWARRCNRPVHEREFAARSVSDVEMTRGCPRDGQEGREG